MADTVRTTIYLSTDASHKLKDRTGPRGRGEYLSELITRDRGPLLPGQGVSERIEERLGEVLELLELLRGDMR